MSVASQIDVSDVAQLKTLGFKSIICNRPDGEAIEQPTYDQIATAADQNGLRAIYLPAIPGQIDMTDVQKFKDALNELPSPILAYCRSGARSEMLWSAAQS